MLVTGVSLSRCRACGGAVRWVSMPSGRRLPLDAEPSADGRVVCLGGDRARFVPNHERQDYPGRPLYRVHFQTCPAAAS